MKVLVSAASKHGATAGIADAIGSVFMTRGFEVVVKDPGLIEEVHTFDAIVVGSAVYAGPWMKPAIELTERFAKGSLESLSGSFPVDRLETRPSRPKIPSMSWR